MGKRAASSKATRGASKGKKPISSGSSNPKTTKFRSQYNSLAVIAKGAPSKKIQNKEAMKKTAKEAVERSRLLNDFDTINMIDKDESNPKEVSSSSSSNRKSKKNSHHDNVSQISDGSRLTTASFASVWSNCTNSSLNEFFLVWNPKLETHKDALAVIAGLSQIMSSTSTQQSDIEYANLLLKLISSKDTPIHVLTGALLALTFVMRKLSTSEIDDNLVKFYPVLKDLMEKYHKTKKKSLVKCLIRCFAAISKTHPLGKKAIESSLRKKINIAIRQHKVQDKIQL